MEINCETGEICSEKILLGSCSKINLETGEREKQISKQFKIQCNECNVKKEKKIKEKDYKPCCAKGTQKYAILLAVVTLCMVVPPYGITLWVVLEILLHIYSHKRSSSYRIRNPIHRNVIAEFCAICQAERSMNFIGKLQDTRTMKMRQYVKTIPIGS